VFWRLNPNWTKCGLISLSVLPTRKSSAMTGVTINRTRPHRQHRTHTGPHRAGNASLFCFDAELKGVRRANYPQLTKEMNPSRCSWWAGDGRSRCFLLIQLKPKHQHIEQVMGETGRYAPTLTLALIQSVKNPIVYIRYFAAGNRLPWP